MKKGLSSILKVFIVGIASISFSCTEISLNQKNVKLIPKTEKYDGYTFVVPANFSFKEEYSLVYENQNLIRAFLVYTGTGNISKIAKFFETHLPNQGWKKVSSLYGESVLLSYTKGSKLMIVKIQKGITTSIIKIMLTTN